MLPRPGAVGPVGFPKAQHTQPVFQILPAAKFQISNPAPAVLARSQFDPLTNYGELDIINIYIVLWMAGFSEK